MTAREVLDGIKAGLAGITPGEWKAWDRGIGYEVHGEYDEPINIGHRETFTKADAVFIAAAPATVARLTGALEAVLAVHQQQGDSYKTCTHCVRPSGYPNRGEQPVRWPCPTVAAIEGALQEGQ